MRPFIRFLLDFDCRLYILFVLIYFSLFMLFYILFCICCISHLLFVLFICILFQLLLFPFSYIYIYIKKRGWLPLAAHPELAGAEIEQELYEPALHKKGEAVAHAFIPSAEDDQHEVKKNDKIRLRIFSAETAFSFGPSSA